MLCDLRQITMNFLSFDLTPLSSPSASWKQEAGHSVVSHIVYVLLTMCQCYQIHKKVFYILQL